MVNLFGCRGVMSTTLVGIALSFGNMSIHISSFPCSTPGLSSQNKVLVSTYSGTRWQPPGTVCQFFNTFSARCSFGINSFRSPEKNQAKKKDISQDMVSHSSVHFGCSYKPVHQSNTMPNKTSNNQDKSLTVHTKAKDTHTQFVFHVSTAGFISLECNTANNNRVFNIFWYLHLKIGTKAVEDLWRLQRIAPNVVSKTKRRRKIFYKAYYAKTVFNEFL